MAFHLVTGSSNPPYVAPTTTTSTPATSVPLQSSSIVAENQRSGDPAWAPPNTPRVWSKVRGFADHVSAQQGDTVGVYVTTAAPTFHVEAYRMGWYGGAQARLVWRSADLPGVRQPALTADPKTGMRDASRWRRSLEVSIDGDWVPGVYMLKLVSSDGGQSLVPLTVRDDASHAAILVQSSVTTWQAYNRFGGASLYTDEQGQAAGRSEVVTFDRPYDGEGSGEFFGREDHFVQQVESMGLDVTYTTDIDTNARPELLLGHRLFVSGAHDEYWSLAMRNGVEAARDQGVNLLFMGANASYRRIRLESSALGPNRHEINYRIASADPVLRTDPQEVTTSWRQLPDPRPESAMIGDFYECNPVSADMKIVDPGFFLFAGTGVRAGTTWPRVVGNEYDRVTPESPTPTDIHVVAHSPLTCHGVHSFADMTYYTAPAGAGVLASGTFWLEPSMGPLCPQPGASSSQCQIRGFLSNVLTTFAAGPVGLDHPSVNNLAQLGIHAHYIKPTPP
jgi:hypothetical protein